MSDVNANIKVSIDSSQALSELKSLQRQISLFHTNIAKSSAQAALAQRTLQTDLLNAINATGRFSAEMRTIKTSTEAFTNSLEKNKFSVRQYFRYAAGSTKTFGKLFRNEFDTISQVAEDRVKRMQTQYIKMGRDATGAMRAMAITPKQLNMEDYGTKVQIAAQKQQLFNQLLKQGSTNLLNFGKNTQWAGRQLMVGFTLPLALLGSTAAKSFMDMETAAIKFRKVYGDLLTPAEETQNALNSIKGLADEFTKYGIAAAQTVSLAADAAAAGFKGLDLQEQTTQATRLSVLGQIDQQKALETTIALQNAFRISNVELADAINFLNSVENQTVLSLDDITTAIPIAAPIVKSLGGDVKDLAFFMTAMKEGGIDAAEGANAIKSGLASIINPTKKASDMLASVGINIRGIVEKNKGDLQATVIGIAEALNTLRPLDRARAIEQLFGKFQFSRISTLFANIVSEGTQASRVLDLTQTSMEDLATTADKELGITADSAMNKFKKTVEDLKVSLIPVGQAFLEAVTPLLEKLNNILSKFKDMSDGSKKAITLIITAVGGLGPVLLMTFGLLANGLANILKLFAMLRGGYLKLSGQTNILGEQTQYLTSEQLEAAAVASSLDQSHARLTQRFTIEAVAVNQLRDAYIQATSAATRFAINNPGLMATPKKFASGGEVFKVPGTGNTDSVAAMLTPGEIVVPKKQSQKYGSLLKGIIADNIPGYQKGLIQDPSMQGGVKRMLAPYTMLAPGNFAGGFGMDRGFLNTSGFAQSLRNTAVAAGAVEGDIKLTQDLINQMSREVMPYAESITETLRNTSNALNEAGTPAKHISELFARAEIEIKAILNSMTEQGGRMAHYATGLQKFAYPTAEDIATGGYARVPGVTVNPITGDITRSTIYGDKSGKTTSFENRLKNVSKSQPIESSGVMTKAHVVPENMAIVSGTAPLKGAALKLPMDLQTKARSEIERKGAMVAGREYAAAYSSGLDQGGLKDIYLESREGRKSPHPMASRDGNDDAIAYEKSKRGKLNSLLTYGTTEKVSAIDKSIRRNNEKRLKDISKNMSVSAGTLGMYGLGNTKQTQEKRNEETKKTTKNLQGMNNALMSGTFALTSLAAMGSMTGGKIGNLSQQIMKYSGLLFALMTVTQLLTQAKITELAATRMGIARKAIAGATGMAAGPGFMGGLARLGLGITKFLGPIGIATTVITTVVAGLNLYKKTQEEARRKLEAFANVAGTTAKQLEASDKYFGVKSKQSGLERKIVSEIKNDTDNSARTAIDEFKKSNEFKEYSSAVKSTRELSMSSARTGLLVKGQELLGRGYSKEQASIIINSIAEEAGKNDLVLDFKDIKIQDLDKQIREGLRPELAKLGKWSGKALANGIFANKNYLADLKNAATGTKSYLNSINLLTENGLIPASDALKSFRGTIYAMSSATDDARIKTSLFNSVLAGMNNPIAMAAAGTDNLTKKVKLLEVATIGAVIPAALMNKYLHGFAFESDLAAREIDALIAEYIKIKDKFYKSIQDQGKSLGDGDENALQALIRRTKETKAQIQAFKELRKAGIDAAIAEEMAANVDLVKILQGTKYLGDNWRKAVEAIKNYEYQQKALEKTIAVGGGPGDYQQYLFKRAEAFISLQEQLIDIQYRTQLKNIDTEVKALNMQLDSIKEQEDQINEKFDKQITALNTIKTLNENIANQEKQRLTIADALSRGDISAAAMAVQEARAQQASASMEVAQQGLATGKENAILGLGAKKIQQQIDALNKQKTIIEDTIEKQKESIKYFGMTADQIRDAARALDLANDAGIDINNETFLNTLLAGAKGDASALKAVMISLQEEARKLFDELNNLRKTFLTTTAPAGGSGTGSYYNNLGAALVGTAGYENMGAQAIAQERYRESGGRFGAPPTKMYGGLIRKYRAGGIVGGTGMTDKVPALLTPGEYVVNRNATKAFGPLLRSINESKYPGSIAPIGSSAVLGINNTAINNNSTSVYNYSLNIDASGSSANPNDIARVVMRQIKNIDSQRIRGNRY